MPALKIWHHHHRREDKGKKVKILDLLSNAIQCMQGNLYFESAPLLTSQVAVMVGQFKPLHTERARVDRVERGEPLGCFVKSSAVPESAGSKLF